MTQQEARDKYNGFVDFDGLLNGFDYEHQAWVQHGEYVRCGHPDDMDCRCFGKLHEGELLVS